jgi:SART-1 family
MAEEDRHKKNMELKIKKRDYTGYDDDEFVEGNQGLMKRSILAKYDEELEGTQQSVRCVCYTLDNANCFLGIPTGGSNHVD